MQKPSHPVWETVVMILSFALLWAWLGSRIYLRQAPNAPIGTFWAIVQIVAVVVLTWIFVRRLNRVRRALKETGEQLGFSPRSKKK